VGYLGKLTRSGASYADNPVLAGGWTVKFDPADIGIRVAAEVYHMAVQGPASSQFQVWIDDVFYDNAVRGDINSWDPAQPMFIRPGDTVFLHWNTAGGNAPKVTLFFREPSPL
jgi:hypothetical protein